jgi:phytoene desaturase
MADYDVVVIGAGCGGLSAGSILARQGRKVLVVEQQDRVGGCCSTFDREGFKFDVGASVVEVIHPIETAFNELGTSFFKECDLIPVDPIYSYIEPDGNHIDYPVSIEETRKVYEKIDPHDAESWTKMTDYFFDMINKLIKVYAVNPANNPLDMIKMVMKYPGMLKFIPLFFRSYQDVLEKYFRNPVILETMAFQSYYVGLPPELCPGYVALIPYSEHEGIYYPRGGMIKIPQAFQRVGESFGMEVRMQTLIDKVLVRNRRVEGVRLSDGTEISCDIVVSDTHALNLYFKLIGEEHLPLLPKLGLKTIKPSMGSPMIYLGLDYKPPLTAHHSLTIESMDLMNDYWWNYHLKGKLPSQPFSLICWTSDTDPGMAPEGMHVLNIMNVGPYHLADTTWDAERKVLADRVIEYLDGFAVPGLADHVVYQEVCTPPDMEKMLLNPEGSIYGINMDLPNSVVFRPSSKSKAIKGLYLTGASTHPGGGVPTVTASGYVAAKLIEKYEK